MIAVMFFYCPHIVGNDPDETVDGVHKPLDEFVRPCGSVLVPERDQLQKLVAIASLFDRIARLVWARLYEMAALLPPQYVSKFAHRKKNGGGRQGGSAA